MATLLLTLTILIEVSLNIELKTSIVPCTAETNPYLTIRAYTQRDTCDINSLHPLLLHFTNLTVFHSIASSTINIIIHSNQVLNNPSLDVFVSFVFNSKYFTVKVNMKNDDNNQISPKCGSLLSKSNSNINWNPLNASDLMPPNLYHFDNIFPLQFVIENNPNNNYLRIKYRSNYSGYFQQCQFAESLPPNQVFTMMMRTATQYPSIYINQFDIFYTVNMDDISIIMAQYLLIIRNKNIYNLYSNEYTLRNKLALAVAQYFKDVSYIVIMTSIQYKNDKHHSDITFQIKKKVNDIERNDINEDEINNIYRSYNDAEFYYLITFYLNLEWDIGQNANYVLNQYKQGNEMHIKRDLISIYLIDFPLSSNTIGATQTSTMSTNQYMKYGVMTTGTTDVNGTDKDGDADDIILRETVQIMMMSWVVCILIVVLLLLLVLIMGILIIYIDFKTQRLEGSEQQRNKRLKRKMPIVERYWKNVNKSSNKSGDNTNNNGDDMMKKGIEIKECSDDEEDKCKNQETYLII